MSRKISALCIFLVIAAAMAAAADSLGTQAKLTAAQIVEKNIAARGGLQAWRAVNSMSMSGKMEAGGTNRPSFRLPGTKASRRMPAAPSQPAEQVQLPFVMELKRPRKVRVELQFNGQTAVQVFDGANGWKLRPFLNRLEVEPYTAEEMKSTATQAELDGYLVDYAAKGIKVEFVGAEKVENRNSYKLQLTLKSGQVIHEWIDAETFLETKIEGNPRRLDGKYHPVEVYMRDYRSVNGLAIPYLLETRVLSAAKTPGFKDLQPASEKIVIEKVAVNPKLDDKEFSKPVIGGEAAAAKPSSIAGGHSLP